MDKSLIKDIGVGGFFLFLALKMFFNYLNDKKISIGSENISLSDIKDKLETLMKLSEDSFRLHNVKDGDGVPVWYVRRSMETQIKELAKIIERLAISIEVQTKVLESKSKDK